jgi:DNA-binding CsgD family transcriptional regulator
LILRMVPLRGAAAATYRPASAIIILLDAGRVSLPTEPQLRRGFGLSDGEARLAIRLAAGQTLEAAAGLGGISYETARKRLKVVFEKTDTCRQSELVALMIRVGAFAVATRAASGETIPSRPRHPAAGHAPVYRRQHPQPHVTPRSDQWKSTA